jgi:ssRNA-specific RNase YbeY (16S rRNA maturation enzyme)
MLIHGVLHLLGYDHDDSSRRAAEMFKLQELIFQEFLKGEYGKESQYRFGLKKIGKT